ncbi:hypothetical protein [Methylomicrobium album]|nr:hypothetical protein [Methylomicrobium album]
MNQSFRHPIKTDAETIQKESQVQRLNQKRTAIGRRFESAITVDLG